MPEQQLLPRWRHTLGGQRLVAAAVELAACCATMANAVNPSATPQQAVIHAATVLVSFTCALLLMINGLLALTSGLWGLRVGLGVTFQMGQRQSCAAWM